jgi:micrococcal nuclease
MPSRRLLRQWLVAAIVLALLWLLRATQPVVPPAGDPSLTVRIRRVVDGDTLVLESGERVRLIGIDTPELARDGRPAEPWAEEARDYLRQAVDGGGISLGFDREERDQYGRRLAYVYRQGRLINEEIIRQGLSRAKTVYHYSPAMKERFLRAEREAREARRGIWSQERKTKA